MSTSSSSFMMITLKAGATLTISSWEISKGFCEVHHHGKAEFYFLITLCLLSIFFLSLKQKINLSSLPPIAMTKAHDFMEFATIYIEISSHDLIIYSTASLTGIGFMFLAAVHSYLLLANQ